MPHRRSNEERGKPPRVSFVGRGTSTTPANRFERIQLEPDPAELLDSGEIAGDLEHVHKVATQLYEDAARSIVRENASPDLPFRYTINPYRGCEHGCAYCYARPTHETLGFNAGLDFETKLLVKRQAATLLRNDLDRPSWQGEPITISGVTDCYQPVERRFQLTRACLLVCAEYRQPVSIVTKNALVLRDLDVLSDMARGESVHVFLSITTLDESLARIMEPRTASIASRWRAVNELSAAGIPVGIMVAPVIPGLNDHEIPEILRAGQASGARTAGWQLLRLPLAVGPIFQQWLADHRPEARERIESRMRECRGGRLNDSGFGSRMRGQGTYAEQLSAAFRTFARKYGLDRPLPALDSSQFRRPREANGQRHFPFVDEADPLGSH